MLYYMLPDNMMVYADLKQGQRETPLYYISITPMGARPIAPRRALMRDMRAIVLWQRGAVATFYDDTDAAAAHYWLLEE